MSVRSSLPDRPLRESEVVSLNRSAAVELAVATEPTGPTAGVVVATDDWVKGLAFDGIWNDGFDGDWTVVETVSLADAERYEGLQRCEAAVRAFLGEIESAAAEEGDAPADIDGNVPADGDGDGDAPADTDGDAAADADGDS